MTGIGTRTADSREGTSSNAPILRVEYVLPPGANTPVAFDTAADADGRANRIDPSASAGTEVGITASAQDADSGDTVAYSLDDDRFAIDPVTGVVTGSDIGILDFGPEGRILLTVTANSSDGSSDARIFTIEPTSNVSFVPDPGAFGTISPEAMAGTATGITALAIDPTLGDTVTYSLDDDRFAIDRNRRHRAFRHRYAGYRQGTRGHADRNRDIQKRQRGGERIRGNSPCSAITATATRRARPPWYTGVYGSGSDINRFFPVVGNKEYSDGDVNDYFDFQVGGVHFLGLNRNIEEPDIVGGGLRANHYHWTFGSVLFLWLSTDIPATRRLPTCAA